MNLPDALHRLKNADHSDSFRQLEPWLNQHSPRKRRSPVFKVAASFITLALIIVACSLPVDHTREAGYMISGKATLAGDMISYEEALTKRGIDINEIGMSQMFLQKGNQPAQRLATIKWILPESSHEEAEEQARYLEEVFDVEYLDVIPITDTVREPLYATLLDKTLNIKPIRTAQIKLKGSVKLQENVKGAIDSTMEAQSVSMDNIRGIKFRRVDGQLKVELDTQKSPHDPQAPESPGRPRK